jgi:hypothetical protein
MNLSYREGGMLGSNSLAEANLDQSGFPPDKKFLSFVKLGEKSRGMMEFERLVNIVSSIDIRCGEYMYKMYYEEKSAKEIHQDMNLKKAEGYRVANKMHYIVGILAEEVAFH